MTYFAWIGDLEVYLNLMFKQIMSVMFCLFLLFVRFIKSLPSLAPCNIGGILADEMGLGKTLEVISLICTNPYPDWNNCGGHLKNLDDEPFNYEKKLDLDFSFSEDVLCCCGSVEETETFKLVQCEFCNGPKQHNICVQYNPQQYEHLFPIKPNYICPQCWANVSF